MKKDFALTTRLHDKAIPASSLQHFAKECMLGKDFTSALAYIDEAIKREPTESSYHIGRANILYHLQDFHEALNALNNASELPHNPAAIALNRGAIYNAMGEPEKALPYYDEALKHAPELANAHYNKGNALRKLDKFEEAIDSFKRAHTLQPREPVFLNNLALTYQDSNQLEQAINTYQKALALNPNYHDANFNCGLCHLLRGNFIKGFALYEWRLNNPNNNLPKRRFTVPLWQGEPLQGKHLYCYAEQGFGDAIQFIRYVSLLNAMGAKVSIECRPPLVRLFQQISGIVAIHSSVNNSPEADFVCSLLSLPYLCQTTVESLPAHTPYLAVTNADKQHWQSHLGQADKRIGFCFAGSPTHKNDRHRSIALAYWQNYFESCQQQAISLVCLQKDIKHSAALERLNMICLDTALNDFYDTACVIACCDEIVTVDTSVAHLAGAQGKKVTVLLPFAPDWRWMLARNDSPWYPSMRLLRQPALNDWDSVFNQLISEQTC